MNRGAQAADIFTVAPPTRSPAEQGYARTTIAALSSIPAGPFERRDLGRRLMPFAIVSVLAAASLALPPGPKSNWDAAAAIALLAVAAGGCALPWSRARSPFTALTVLVPLAYLGSVLMMILSSGTAVSGISVLILAPLIWTALYHRRWESAVVVVGAMVVQFTSMVTPVVEPAATIARRVVLWGLLSALLSVATHDLGDRVRGQVAGRDELLRQMIALEAAAEELTATLDPEDVVSRAPRLAAELVSAPGTPGRRAQYSRVTDGIVRFVAQYDESGQDVTELFPLVDSPYLAEVLQSRHALSVHLDPQVVGPSVRNLMHRLGVTHSIYVPVVVGSQVDGVLSVSTRGGDLSTELVEQCKALGHLLELALANALMHRAAHEQAYTDPLTALPNRRGFEELIANRPGRRPFVILVLDLDGLKMVNDSLGHHAGDALLVRVADVVRGTMRRGDVLARLGGDEFAAYLFDADEVDGCRVADRMLEALVSPVETVTASVSIGLAMGLADDDARQVHSAADAAMYRAKRSGGRRYEVAPPPATPVLAAVPAASGH